MPRPLASALRGPALVLAAAAAPLAVPAALRAQAGYAGGTYTQDFNTLATAGTNNTTVPAGLVFARAAGGDADYRAATGSDNAGDFYSFGAAGSAERAFGTISSGTTGTQFFGLLLRNLTGTTLTQFTVAYTGEQWRNGGNTAAQTLVFGYAFGTTDVTTGAATGVGSLDFTSPTVGAAAAALDGNAAGNRAARSGTVTGVAWAPNQLLLLRWQDDNDAGNDHALAVDDLSFSASAAAAVVPEPTSVALLGAGLLGVAAAGARRRRPAR